MTNASKPFDGFYLKSKPIDLRCEASGLYSPQWRRENKRRLAITRELLFSWACYGVGNIAHVDSLGIDLDKTDVVTNAHHLAAFEVLEHLCNPLAFLRSCADHLRLHESHRARLFITTPLVMSRLRPTHGLRCVEHFQEFDIHQLRTLFDLAGLEVLELRTFRMRPWWQFLNFRGLIRWWTDRTAWIVLGVKS